MYDAVLRQDLIDFRKSLYNIDEYRDRYKQMQKIIQCRTEDKIYFLRLLLNGSIINEELYQELYNRVRSDYNKSCRYILSFCQI